jgi:hypothetical protein
MTDAIYRLASVISNTRSVQSMPPDKRRAASKLDEVREYWYIGAGCWRMNFHELEGRSEAIRRLVELALKAQPAGKAKRR